MEKTVIVINGAGGAGKDSICAAVARHVPTRVVSSIDPIRAIAARGGWDASDKSLRGRKLLAALKQAFIDYNDLPLNYLMGEYERFLAGEDELLFVHIREPEEIEKFRARVTEARFVTLLIKAARVDALRFGNDADDRVAAYAYDFVYRNDGDAATLERDFMRFFEGNIRK